MLKLTSYLRSLLKNWKAVDSKYLTASALKKLYDLDFKSWCWLLYDNKKSKKGKKGANLYCIKEIKERYSAIPEQKFLDRFICKKEFKKEFGEKRFACLASILAKHPRLFSHCSFGYGGRGGKFYLKSLLEAITYSRNYKQRVTHKKEFLDGMLEVKGTVFNVVNETDFIFKANPTVMIKEFEKETGKVKLKEAVYFDCRLQVDVDNIQDIKIISGSFAKNTLNNSGLLKIFYVVKIIE